MLLPIKLSRSGHCPAAGFGAAFQQEIASISASISHLFSPRELLYFESLRYPLRRDSFLLGRCAAKRAILECVQQPAFLAIEILQGVFNQPIATAQGGGAITELSLSHSSGAAVAVACELGHPIGVDLEFIRKGESEFLKTCLSPRDETLLSAIPQPLNIARYLIWSMKEALSKALRCGLMTPFQVLEISELTSVGPDSCTVRFTNFAQYKAHAWVLGRYILSVALPEKSELQFSPNILSEHLATAQSFAAPMRAH
jgi:4'-phosphopantetheinyl transferase